MKIADGVHVFERPQRPRGFDLPSRMTALSLADGSYALLSPIALDEERLDALRELGEIRYLIAPNLLHHLHLEVALAAFPGARVIGPGGIEKKRPSLKSGCLAIDTTASDWPEELMETLEWIPLEGAPTIDEWAIAHRPSRTLVLTDLVFHILEPRGFLNGLILRLNGTHQRLGVSRLFAAAVKDKAAMRSSIERLLERAAELKIERVVPAHGDRIEGEDATRRLEAALRARFF